MLLQIIRMFVPKNLAQHHFVPQQRFEFKYKLGKCARTHIISRISLRRSNATGNPSVRTPNLPQSICLPISVSSVKTQASNIYCQGKATGCLEGLEVTLREYLGNIEVLVYFTLQILGRAGHYTRLIINPRLYLFGNQRC